MIYYNGVEISILKTILTNITTLNLYVVIIYYIVIKEGDNCDRQHTRYDIISCNTNLG